MSATPRTDALLLEINEGRVYTNDGPTAELCRAFEQELARCASSCESFKSALSDTIAKNEDLISTRDELVQAMELALEYWAHRQQRYKNRSPVWVEQARAALANAGKEGA